MGYNPLKKGKRVNWATAFILLVILILIYIGHIKLTGNFHVVSAGTCYRSGQLSPGLLTKYVLQYEIKSILNLRGENPDKNWYVDEIDTAKKLNINHYDVSLSSTQRPTHEDLVQLSKIFRDAPRPILIHCEGGADRSGLVAAMWKVYVDKASKSDAKQQLSFWFGHFPVFGTREMDRFFDAWYSAFRAISDGVGAVRYLIPAAFPKSLA